MARKKQPTTSDSSTEHLISEEQATNNSMQETNSNNITDESSAEEAIRENTANQAQAARGETAAGAGPKDAQQLQDELDQLADRNLRLQAEMENLRGRASREIAENRRYAALPLMRDVLPVVDNVSRALEAAAKTDAAAGLLEGFKLVKQQLLGALAQHGCTEIEALGEPFDPHFHEAIQQQPSDEFPAQSVCLVAQSGYRLHDRVIRPAQVIVSTGPADSDDQSG